MRPAFDPDMLIGVKDAVHAKLVATIAADATAWRPEEQKRLIVAPDVVAGQPAQSAALRATRWS